MKRMLFALALGLIAAPAVRAQDEVYHFDKASKKVIQTSGTITEESAAGVKVKPTSGAARAIPAQDAVNIIHQTKVPRLTHRPPFTAEENAAKAATAAEQQKFLKAALTGFQEVLPKLAGDNKFAARHVQYKIARLQA